MKRVDVPVKQMGKFEGKWVAIDTEREYIIAVGDSLKDISSLVTGKAGKEKKIKAYSFKVPRHDEGPYVLVLN